MKNEDIRMPYIGADALNDALIAAGIDCVFLNLGTDYPPIVESWAKYESEGKKIPRVIISPHEYAGLSAAQGYAQITGKPQAVFVHVDVGTENMGGAVHNAFRVAGRLYSYLQGFRRLQWKASYAAVGTPRSSLSRTSRIRERSCESIRR